VYVLSPSRRTRPRPGSADRVGILGTSSGGLLTVLAAMRPDDPRYRALPLADAPHTDAKLAFMVSAWGGLFPLDRYNIAKAKDYLDRGE
jgi:acetyl esterase/lipase